MSRSKSDYPYHVFDYMRSSKWYIWFYDSSGKRRQRSTELPKSHYTKEQAQAEINRRVAEKTGKPKKSKSEFSIDWFIKRILNQIEQQGRRES